jgi:TPP-dependent pyruvate/acetoin dehydrogenase alpha subunit
VAVGVCGALNKTDWIASTHRGHSHCIARDRAADIIALVRGQIGLTAGAVQ